jgi:hypothetical protein
MISLKEEITNWRRECFQSKRKILVAQWLGYIDSPNDFFKKIPNNIDVINMAYAVPTTKGLSFDCLTKFISKDLLKETIKTLRKRGIKVILSITDHQDYQWNQVNYIKFISDIFDVLDEWGFDGIDMQCQSEIIILSNFEEFLINLIKNLRKVIQEDRLITFTSHDSKCDTAIIKNTVESLDWINLILADNNLESLVNRYQKFNNIENFININIGISLVDKSLKTVQWDYIRGKNSGIYLWGLNKDFKNNFEQTRIILDKIKLYTFEDLKCRFF